MRLGGELWAPVTADDEKEFTLRTVLPILRKLRFQNVRYTHGNANSAGTSCLLGLPSSRNWSTGVLRSSLVTLPATRAGRWTSCSAR